MASHNSYNYCLSECCTAQVAVTGCICCIFSLKGPQLQDLELIPWHVCLLCHRTHHTVTSPPWNWWPWEMLHSFFFLHIFVMDFSFNKPKRTTAFDAGALCASAKSCRRSWGWICNLTQTVHGRIDVVAPFSTAGQGGDGSSMKIPFPIKFYTRHVKQIPSRTAPGIAKAWDEQNWTGTLQKVITYL